MYLTEQNFDKIINLIMKEGNYAKNSTFLYQISNISILLINPCYTASQTGKHSSEKEITLHLKPAYNNKDWYEYDVDHIVITKKQKNNFNIWAENIIFDKTTHQWKEIKLRQKGRDYSKPHNLAEPWFKTILEQKNSIIINDLPFEKPNAKKHSIEPFHTQKAKVAIYKYLKNNRLKYEDNPLTEKEIENIQKIYLNWDKFNVQYFGLIENEKPIIYANYYPKEDDYNVDLRAIQKVTFDGGFWYWQVEYDLESDSVINIAYNGEA